jgi:hypothetical protein
LINNSHRKFLALILLLAVVIIFFGTEENAHADPDDQGYLDKIFGLPHWISLSGEFRTRYETLNANFRRNSTGSDQILSLRTLVRATFELSSNFKVNLEMQDSRAELADLGSRLNPTIVNTAELLEGNVVLSSKNLFAIGDKSQFRAGRLTMDIGKRRFIARNRFRNVIQAYTGVDWKWVSPQGTQIRTLFTLPVNREPTKINELLQNDASFDKETINFILWGIFLNTPKLPWGNSGDLYLFVINEDDGDKFNTRNRHIYTPGFRIFRPSKEGQFDYEWEAMYQFGSTRATNSPSDNRDLDHFAYFHHIEGGYTFPVTWSPRLSIEYDFASGDEDPADGENNRFERLFGPNVPEFGPTSIYTAFVRANINSPGLRLQIRPKNNLFAYLSYRAFWLASEKDGWQGASGLRDTKGNSGRYLGQQFLLRIKWNAQSNIKFEGGLVYLIDGEFQENVPQAPKGGNTVYSYISTTLLF